MNTLLTAVLVFGIFTNQTNVIKQSNKPQIETKKTMVIVSPVIEKQHNQQNDKTGETPSTTAETTESTDTTEYLCLVTSDGVTECHVLWTMPDGTQVTTGDDAPPVGWIDPNN